MKGIPLALFDEKLIDSNHQFDKTFIQESIKIQPNYDELT